jgi:hypothetical protein
MFLMENIKDHWMKRVPHEKNKKITKKRRERERERDTDKIKLQPTHGICFKVMLGYMHLYVYSSIVWSTGHVWQWVVEH